MQFNTRFVVYGGVLCAMALWMGCGSANSGTNSPADPNAPIAVLCTTQQVADLVKRVGGEHVTVEVLFGPGVDPHTYRANTLDTQKLQSAQMIFYNGLHLEGKMAELLEDLGAKKPTLGLGEALEKFAPTRLRHPPEFPGGSDPHIWFDAELWSLTIPAVVEKLSEFKPQHRAAFTAGGEAYRKELLQIDAECKEQLATIPKEQRVLVTAHDAFGYFGAAYGIEVHGLQGISTVSEANLGHINELADLLTKRKIKALFVESSVPPENLRNVIKGCADHGHSVVVGGELFSDAMGPANEATGTYAGMMRYNLKTIVDALK